MSKKPLSKNDFVKIVAEAGEFDTQKEAERAVNSFMKAIKAAMEKDEKVSLIGFGNFEVSHRAARAGRNPKTGEAMQIKASKSVKFSPGKALKEAVN